MNEREENLVERCVEKVPARVNEETGEQFFSPVIVEHLQRLILG